MAHKRKVVKTNKGAVEASKKVKKVKTKKELEIEKYGKPKLTELQKLFPVRPLTTFEGNQFKELVQLSNTQAAVMKDINEKEIMAYRLRVIAKKIRAGDIKPPLIQEILPKLFAQYTDMKEAVTVIEENAKSLENAAQFALGQLGHRYEEYVDALIRYRNRLNEFIGTAKLKTVSHHRTDAKSDKEQLKNFDKGFEEFAKNEIEVKAKIAEREAKEILNQAEEQDKKAAPEELDKHTSQEVAKAVEDSWKDKAWKDKQEKMSKK